MEVNKLASYIAMHEGKKSQVSIGDIREILKILIQIEKKWIQENISGATNHTLLSSPLGDLIKQAAQPPKVKLRKKVQAKTAMVVKRRPKSQK